MNTDIYDYLIKEKNKTPAVATLLMDKICKHEEIKREFIKWLKQRDYDFDEPLNVSGYTAKVIFEMAPFLDGIGVFNFMVTLKENPEKAQQYIREGFAIK